MINPKVAAALAVTILALLLAWNGLFKRAYDNTVPPMEGQSRNAEQYGRDSGRQVGDEMEDIGAIAAELPDNPKNQPDDKLPATGMPPRQHRPLGLWEGVCERDGASPALMKFDDEYYWLRIKKPGGADIVEKGKYEYRFNSILFRPEGKSSYYLDYFMVSKNGIRLSGYNCSYNLERQENISLDF